MADAYRSYMPMPYDRPTWDLTSALYAVRPGRQYFALSPAGRVSVDEDGQTRFTPASRDAISNCNVPVMFTSLVASGLSTERGTDRSAA